MYNYDRDQMNLRKTHPFQPSLGKNTLTGPELFQNIPISKQALLPLSFDSKPINFSIWKSIIHPFAAFFTTDTRSRHSPLNSNCCSEIHLTALTEQVRQ